MLVKTERWFIFVRHMNINDITYSYSMVVKIVYLEFINREIVSKLCCRSSLQLVYCLVDVYSNMFICLNILNILNNC